MSIPNEKITLIHEDLNLVCRACLSNSGVLKNMFDWGLVTDFYKLTNISVHATDTVSKSLCLTCEDLLSKCIQFKRQCEESDLVLRDAEQNKLIESSQSQNTTSEVCKNEIRFVVKESTITYLISAPNQDDKIYFPCPYSCDSSFLKQTDLLNHLKKLHQKEDCIVDVKFHCSFPDCVYHEDSNTGKYFVKRKVLNQHYHKVHGEKIICTQCEIQFTRHVDYEKHLQSCCKGYSCQVCDRIYRTEERLMVHLKRSHPDFHSEYKMQKSKKRKSESLSVPKKTKLDEKQEYVCDSPKRSLATQTLSDFIKTGKHNVLLPSCSEARKDEISTQTVFDDLLSQKSEISEDDSIYASETVLLSDIQTQTFPVEFGLFRSNKETLTSETQSPDLSIKETQTCLCLYDQAKASDGISLNSNSSLTCISTETQTFELDDLMRFNSAETQTSLNDLLSENGL